MSRRTPTAAGQGASPPPEPTPAGEASASAAPIVATDPTSTSAPATELVPTRVIGGGYGHQIDSVLQLPPDQAAEAERLGWGDTRHEAVAEAERLNELHRANQDMEKRLRLEPQRGRNDPQDGSWRSPHDI